MLSRFGKIVRKRRIDMGVNLKTMADALGKSSAYLSAVETGRKNPTRELVTAAAEYFSLGEPERAELEEAAYQSASQLQISMEGFNDSQREVVASFARRFSSLSESDLKRIRGLLNGE